jgi:23S rRNA (uracil1939-C5)-methyltransferase
MSEVNKSTKKKHRKGMSSSAAHSQAGGDLVQNNSIKNNKAEKLDKNNSTKNNKTVKFDRNNSNQKKDNNIGNKAGSLSRSKYRIGDVYEDFSEDRTSNLRSDRTSKSGLAKHKMNHKVDQLVHIRSQGTQSLEAKVQETNVQETKVQETKVQGSKVQGSKVQETKFKESNSIKSNNKKKAFQEKGKCPYLRECGSCQMMQVEYKEHLRKKQDYVSGLISKFCKVEPIIGMKDPKHYRNKVHVVFDHDRKGNPISGIYEEGTHRVVPIEGCLIHNEKADEIINSIRGMLKSFKIKTYDEDTGYGLLRHVLIRTGFASGEIMVVLVLASPILPSKNNFVKALRKLHPEITTIIINVNDKKTSMVLGDKEHVIYGKGFIEDSLCGKVFRISPKSFYQVNPAQTEIIYGKAIEMADLKGTETIIDAYCGIGTIGLIASDHVHKVIGVELNKDAVKDAIMNAKRNQITNVEFYNQDAGEFMRQLAEQKVPVDTVFMDPPRAGSDEMFMDSVITLKPSKVVYISCNPVTLERDLLYLTKKGYKAVKAIPVDMFPWTSHVETVVLMSRKDK